jgi:hypothetical protein
MGKVARRLPQVPKAKLQGNTNLKAGIKCFRFYKFIHVCIIYLLFIRSVLHQFDCDEF